MKRCGECGSRSVRMRDIRGYDCPWRDYPYIYITQSHQFLGCEDCGNFMFRASELEILDQLIERSITEQVGQFIQIILEREGCSQKELAAHVGVTPEYLSGLKSGRLPGFQTFNFLKTLAMADRKTFQISDPKFDVSRRIAG